MGLRWRGEGRFDCCLSEEAGFELVAAGAASSRVLEIGRSRDDIEMIYAVEAAGLE